MAEYDARMQGVIVCASVSQKHQPEPHGWDLRFGKRIKINWMSSAAAPHHHEVHICSGPSISELAGECKARQAYWKCEHLRPSMRTPTSYWSACCLPAVHSHVH